MSSKGMDNQGQHAPIDGSPARSPLTARRAVLLGVPCLYIVLGALHPQTNPGLGDPSALFIGLHLGQLFLIGGLAVMLWMLVSGINGAAASATRVMILPFVIAYTALDAILGIAWGMVAAKATQLPVADQAAAGRLVDELLADDPVGMVLYWGASVMWLAVALAAVLALRKSAPRPALALITVGALAFATGHARPIGPIGMGLILAGVAWVELRPRADRPPGQRSLESNSADTELVRGS